MVGCFRLVLPEELQVTQVRALLCTVAERVRVEVRLILPNRDVMKPKMDDLDRSPLPFLHLMQNLKHLSHTGWLRTVKNPETVASHSFRQALLGLFAPVGLPYCLLYVH